MLEFHAVRELLRLRRNAHRGLSIFYGFETCEVTAANDDEFGVAHGFLSLLG